METELKFQVPAARRAALLAAVATASARRTRLQAVYADTADQRLAAAGMALRLRKEGRDWVQTLKGQGDGLMQRLEHEVRLPPQRGLPSLDPARHQGTAAGQALIAVLSAGGDGRLAELLPVYRTDIQRLHRQLRHGGALIEIAYDRGWILAGDRRAQVDEIEFELVRGPQAVLPALAARWAARFGLWWDVRTKSERGFRLALGLTRRPPETARPVPLREGMPVAEAWRAMLLATLVHALPNAAEIADGLGGAEHLHQLRVALRRLRTVLHVFADWSADPATARALQLDWRQPFSELGKARDDDVLAELLAGPLAALGAPVFEPSASAPPTLPPAETVRGAAFTQALLRTLALAVTDPQPPSGVGDAGTAAARAGAGAVADLLGPLWRQLRRDARGFDEADPLARHRLRRRAKRLRYALEFVAPLLGGKPARRTLRALRRALDELGTLNDLGLARQHCEALAVQQPGAWFAAGAAAVWAETARRRAARALRRWEKLRLS